MGSAVVGTAVVGGYAIYTVASTSMSAVTSGGTTAGVLGGATVVICRAYERRCKGKEAEIRAEAISESAKNILVGIGNEDDIDRSRPVPMPSMSGAHSQAIADLLLFANNSGGDEDGDKEGRPGGPRDPKGPLGLIELLRQAKERGMERPVRKLIADVYNEFKDKVTGISRVMVEQTSTKNTGVKIKITLSNAKDIMIKIMQKGGIRLKPYYRISFDSSSLGKLGERMQDMHLEKNDIAEFSHINICPNSCENIREVVKNILENLET